MNFTGWEVNNIHVTIGRQMTSESKIKILKAIAGALVAIVPASLTYCQARVEMRQEWADSHDHAQTGYEELVKLVDELQAAAHDQHDQLIRLQTHLADLENNIRHVPRPMAAPQPSPTLTVPIKRFDSLIIRDHRVRPDN